MNLNLVSGGAAHGLVARLTDQFHATTGFRLAPVFGAVGAMKDALIAGAPADLVILTAEAIADLATAGLVARDTIVDIGAVHTGIAIRTGDPAPPIDDTATLREALHEADAIYFPDPARATAGIHFEKILRQLDTTGALTNRIRTFPNGAAAMTAMAAHVGGRPIGCTQVTEILGTAGVTLVANLPREVELVTIYTAAVANRARHPVEARRLAELLAGPSAHRDRETAGFGAAARQPMNP